MSETPDKIRCTACPVLCYIRDGMLGACDRYANQSGTLVRVDPHVLLDRTLGSGGEVVSFLGRSRDWDGRIVESPQTFVTAIGAGTTYPDYKPAPFIVSSEIDGIDMVTVVTEGIFSYCGLKVKIDTDRHLGAETAAVRGPGRRNRPCDDCRIWLANALARRCAASDGRVEEGRPRHLREPSRTGQSPAVEVTVDGGATIVIEAGKAPIINGQTEERMRVGCGSATIGMFAKQWQGLVDEVVVVDDHITGVLSEHQAGKFLGIPETGIRMNGHRSTPGRYFKVAHPGTGWGGTDLSDPLAILKPFDPKVARPGLRLLMVSTTGEHHALLRARRCARSGGTADPRGARPVGGADQGELRACPVDGDLHGRGRRLAARGRDRKFRSG